MIIKKTPTKNLTCSRTDKRSPSNGSSSTPGKSSQSLSADLTDLTDLTESDARGEELPVPRDEGSSLASTSKPDLTSLGLGNPLKGDVVDAFFEVLQGASSCIWLGLYAMQLKKSHQIVGLHRSSCVVI